MQIKKQTPQKLILEATKSYNGLKRFFLFLFATPFFAAGIFIILNMGKIYTLQCQKELSEEISCVLSRNSLISKETINLEKGQLQKAELGISPSDNSNSYRVNLITMEGVIPLAELYSSGVQSKRDNVNRINNFIKNPSTDSLMISQNDRWFAYPFGAVFALSGMGLMFFSLTFFTQVSCIFDKRKQKVFLTEQNLFETRYSEHKIGQIKSAELITHASREGKSYSVDVVFKNNSRMKLYLDHSFSSCQKFIDTLNKFLNLSV